MEKPQMSHYLRHVKIKDTPPPPYVLFEIFKLQSSFFLSVYYVVYTFQTKSY